MIEASPLTLPEGISFLQRGWLNSNSVVVRESEGFTLLDTGYWTGVGALEQELLRAGYAPERLSRIINTHSHPDHCGGNGHLQALTGCPVWMSDIDAMLLEAGDPFSLWTYPQMECPPFEVARTLTPGERIRVGRFDFEALDGSGHASGELSYYCPELRLVVCGDLLWRDTLSHALPMVEGMSGLARHERALLRLRGLDIEVALPGHGPAIVGRDAIQESIRSSIERLHDLRADRVKWVCASLKSVVALKLLQKGSTPERDFVDECARSPWYREHHARFFPGQESLIQELLEALVSSGVVRREPEGRISCVLRA